jgi:carbon-monoxide dehydrogenase large subunit
MHPANVTNATPTMDAGRFVGQSITRKEDPRLLTGRGHLVDDVTRPGMLHAAFLRSHVAHARIVELDVRDAAALPGVHAVLTNADLTPLQQHRIDSTINFAGPWTPTPLLASDTVRFVGDPIAIVVAESRYVAEDACDLIRLELDPLPPVLDFETAATNRTIVHEEVGTNVSHHSHRDEPDLAAVFERSRVVTSTFVQGRQTPTPMETRGIVAEWDTAEQRLNIWVSTQNPHELRLVIARMLGLPANRVRVHGSDVGGGFGQKYQTPREERTIAFAAMVVRRPVKWIEDRRENLMAGGHARKDRLTCTVAVDDDGRILGMQLDHLEDAGAYPTAGGRGTMGLAVVTRFTGPYRVPLLAWDTTAVWTNSCGRGAYRGPWMMETVAREQMIDRIAAEIDMDPLELRRRNVLRERDLPYTSPGGMVLDNVSVAQSLEQAAEVIGYDEFRTRQAAARAERRYLGIGLALYVEPQGTFGPLRREATEIRMLPDGAVDVFIGSGAHGQGLETTTAQIVAEALGVHVDDVTVHQGDTDIAPFGMGTGGSRSGPVLGGAIHTAAAELRTKIAEIAGQLLEAAPEDIVLAEGRAAVRGTPARFVEIGKVARTAFMEQGKLPPGMAPGLEVTSRYDLPETVYSNACHACIVEVDPALGTVTIERYVVSEDCGMVINPMIVEGQIAGGVAQGIAGALYEEFVYDEDGNPLTTTFMDYGLPTAGEIPWMEYAHLETPGPSPGGHKGTGEGGAIGAPPCVFNAVADALRPFGVHPVSTPLTPAVVRDLIDSRGQDASRP